MDNMLKVGKVKFGLGGAAYDQFTHEMSAVWAKQPRIGRKNALQYVGEGQETISLTGTVYGLFMNLGTGTLRAIQDALLDTEPKLVMDGTGRDYGMFVIDSVSETRTDFISDGSPQKQQFTVMMSRYGEDNLSDSAVNDEGSTDLGTMRAAASANMA